MRLQGTPARGRQMAVIVAVVLIVAAIAAYVYLAYIA
jgi:hypothetical protein